MARAGKILVIAAIVGSLTSRANGAIDCPKRCICNKKTGIYDCQNAGLNRIPWTMPNPLSVRELLLSGNAILQISKELATYTNLEILDLGSNHISLIANNAFDNMKNLRVLKLKNNRLSYISEATFAGLENLTSLDLKANYFRRLDANVFQDLRKLEDLDLSRNQISSFHKDAFLGLSQSLFTLDLSGNELLQVPVEALMDVRSVKSLLFSYNSISSVPSHAFRLLRGLNKLSLNGNKIKEIAEFAFHGKDGTELPKLRYLSLKDNELTRVPSKAVNSISSLETLDLSVNPIDMIEPEAFKGLNSLKYLSLNAMPKLQVIRNYAFSDLVELEELQLHSNPELRRVEEYALLSTPSLMKLILYGNKLETLSDYLLRSHDVIVIDFRDNPWNCDCNLGWMCHYLKSRLNNNTRFLIEGVRCGSKSKLFPKRKIVEIDSSTLTCPTVASSINAKQKPKGLDHRVMVGIIAACVCFSATLLVVVLYKYKVDVLKPLRNQIRYRTHKDSVSEAEIAGQDEEEPMAEVLVHVECVKT